VHKKETHVEPAVALPGNTSEEPHRTLKKYFLW